MDSESQSFDSKPTAASLAAFDRFRQMALENETLHERLLAANHTSDFATLAVELGRGLGCSFDEAAVLDALKKARRDWWARWV